MHSTNDFTPIYFWIILQLLIGGTAICVGKIVEKMKCVHGILLRDTELKVQVMKVNYDMEHPDYP